MKPLVIPMHILKMKMICYMRHKKIKLIAYKKLQLKEGMSLLDIVCVVGVICLVKLLIREIILLTKYR